MPDTTAPTTTDKLVGATTFLATNAGTVIAPAIPGNEHNVGGMAVSGIALFINALIQQFKEHDWFKQDKVAIWSAIGLAAVCCALVWAVADPQQALLNFFNVGGLVLTNYGSLKPAGIIPKSGG